MKSFKRFYRENLTVEDAEGNTFTHIMDIIRPQPIKAGAKSPSCGAQPCACTARLWNYQVSDYDPGEPLLQTGGRK